MTDKDSLAGTTLSSGSIKEGAHLDARMPNPSPATALASATTTQKGKSSLRDKLHIGSKTEEPGKESWRDASLSDEKRWKEWQKAKDREQKEG